MRILFMGSGEIAVPSLLALAGSDRDQLVALVAQPDRPAGRHQHPLPPPTKRALADGSIPILQPERIRAPEALAEIAALRPDLIVVMAYGQLLPDTLLQLPRLACINLHASLLPRYRGASPINAAIENGDRRSGITVMYVSQSLDAGDLLLAREIDLLPNDTAGTLHDRLAQIAPAALRDAIKLLRDGRAPRIPQDDSQASYAPKLSRESGRIDWSLTATQIERKIRALNPWPGAFTLCPNPRGGTRTLKIHMADVTQDLPESPAPVPGTILPSPPDRLVVACGQGALLPSHVQLDGARPLAISPFLRGYPLPPGTLLQMLPGGP